MEKKTRACTSSKSFSNIYLLLCVYTYDLFFLQLIRTHTKRLRVSFFVLEIPWYLNGIIVVLIIIIYSYSVPLRIFVFRPRRRQPLLLLLDKKRPRASSTFVFIVDSAVYIIFPPSDSLFSYYSLSSFFALLLLSFDVENALLLLSLQLTPQRFLHLSHRRSSVFPEKSLLPSAVNHS